MILYVCKRLALALPILLAVLTLVFVIVRIAPGDPAMVVLGDQASKEALEAMRVRLGIDRPLSVQYLEFLISALTGNLGHSIVSGKLVIEEIMDVLPFTIDLTLAGVFLCVLFGLPLGVLTALKRNTAFDYVSRIGSLLGLSFPAFYSAILLILAFSIKLRWFPVISEPNLSDPLQRLHHLILPATNLGLIMVAYVTRAARSSMLEVLGEDYIRTARAKGVPGKMILIRHALKNAMIPIITVIGLYLGVMVGNSVLTEIVFNRPGLGRLIVAALEQRDYTLLQGVIVVYAIIIVIVNLITDLTYGFADPRVRYQ